MKKALLIILTLTLATALALTTIAPAMAHTEASPLVTPLLAGQSINVGSVSVWNDGSNLYVKYRTIGWTIRETHLAVVTCADGFAPPLTNPAGNPALGSFPYKGTHADDLIVTYTIPLTWAVDQCLLIAAHAVVYGSGPIETAWASGSPFTGDGGSWATYFTYTVQ